MNLIKTTVTLLITAGSFALLNANMNPMKMQHFQTVKPQEATLLQKGKEKVFCNVCGMNLVMFYKTNYAAKVSGKEKQYCSLHCLVEDKELNHQKLKEIQVVDTKSLKFINASKAYYVVGSHKKGTMSMVSKYAFKKESDAKEFSKKFGGKIMNFNKAYEIAQDDFANDARMIAKKQAMMAKKGAAIYKQKCKKTDKKFSSVANAKGFILANKLCKDVKGKKIHAVGLYLFRR